MAAALPETLPKRALPKMAALAGAALGVAGDEAGEFEEHAGHIGLFEQCAEQDEHVDDRGRSADGGPPDAVVEQVQRFDDLVGGEVEVPHVAGQEVPEEGVQQRDAGHDHKGEAATRRVASRMAMMSPAPQNRSHAVSSSMCGILS